MARRVLSIAGKATEIFELHAESGTTPLPPEPQLSKFLSRAVTYKTAVKPGDCCEQSMLIAGLGAALLQILVIPGNPGSAAYYLPFMQSLHTAYRGRAAVVALSQLGHAAGVGGSSKVRRGLSRVQNSDCSSDPRQ